MHPFLPDESCFLGDSNTSNPTSHVEELMLHIGDRDVLSTVVNLGWSVRLGANKYFNKHGGKNQQQKRQTHAKLGITGPMSISWNFYLVPHRLGHGRNMPHFVRWFSKLETSISKEFVHIFADCPCVPTCKILHFSGIFHRWWRPDMITWPPGPCSVCIWTQVWTRI